MPVPVDKLPTNEAEWRAYVARIGPILANAETDHERMKEITETGAQIRASLDSIRDAQMKAHEYAPPGDDRDVLREYHIPQVNADDLPGRVARKGTRADPNGREGTSYLGSTDAGVVRLYGGYDELGSWMPGLLDDLAPKSAWQLGLQDRISKLAWWRATHPDTYKASGFPAHIMRAVHRHIAKGPTPIARIFADNAGEGGEFAVTLPLATLERTAELGRVLDPMFQVMQLTGPSNTYPFLTNGVQPFTRNTPTAGDMLPAQLRGTVPSTAERTITPALFTVMLPVDMMLLEDALFDFIPVGEDLLGRALVDGWEDTLINGDSAATHGDTAIDTWNPRGRWQVLGSQNDHRKGVRGLRQRAFDVDANVSTAVADYSTLQTVPYYMGARAGMSGPHGFGNLLYLTSPEHYLAKILTDTNLLTVDKYGASATVNVGEVGRIGGNRLMISDFMTSDLAATGLYTGSGSTTSMLMVALDRFRVARRRAASLQMEGSIREQTVYLVATERKTLHSLDGDTVANVRLLINLASS